MTHRQTRLKTLPPHKLPIQAWALHISGYLVHTYVEKDRPTPTTENTSLLCLNRMISQTELLVSGNKYLCSDRLANFH